MSDTWLSAYLRLLDLEPEPPSLDYLRRLTRAHLSRVPFENVSSILRRAAAGEGAVPELDRASELQAWLDRRAGGLCFEVTDMFGALLSGLGFRAHPVLAKISFIGSHQSVVVDVDGGRYLVDAGNGAPFFEPIPLSDAGDPVEVSHVGLAYRFRPAVERSDAWVQDRLIDGIWQPFCTYELGPSTEAERETAYQRHHLRGQSWVVDNLTLVRCTDSAVWSLRDNRLTSFTRDGKEVREITSRADFHAIAADLFALPQAPIDRALDVLGQ